MSTTNSMSVLNALKRQMAGLTEQQCDKKFLHCGQKSFSVRDLIDEIKRESRVGLEIVDMIACAAETDGVEIAEYLKPTASNDP